ncbi:MAG: hypothetical protein A2158_01000 [Chloroflexi bacterium RBG_13_46_14]|nr:MAG: hypothetical protein A2158_01000 [Chloroflexi bacterium RBG_13_46_14]
MKKLVCEKCGREIVDPGDIELVLAGMDAWQNSVRARGEEPRGIFPCKHYRNCGGEMIIVDDKEKPEKSPGKLKNLFRRKP